MSDRATFVPDCGNILSSARIAEQDIDTCAKGHLERFDQFGRFIERINHDDQSIIIAIPCKQTRQTVSQAFQIARFSISQASRSPTSARLAAQDSLSSGHGYPNSFHEERKKCRKTVLPGLILTLRPFLPSIGIFPRLHRRSKAVFHDPANSEN